MDEKLRTDWSTVRDLAAVLLGWNDLSQDEKNRIWGDLSQNLRKIGWMEGLDFDDKDNREKLVNFLNNPERIDEKLGDLEAEEEILETKALDADSLKHLLRDLNEHEAAKPGGLEREVERLTQNKLGQKYRNEIRKIIERQLEIYEQKLEELRRKNPEVETAKLEIVADKSAMAQVLMETELPIEKAESLVEETIIKPSEQAGIKTEKSEMISRLALKNQEIELKKQEKLLEIIKVANAEIFVEKKILEIAKPLTEEIVGSNQKLTTVRGEVEKIVKDNVREVISGEAVLIEDTKVEIDNKGSSLSSGLLIDLGKLAGENVVIKNTEVLRVANVEVDNFLSSNEKTVEEYQAVRVETETWREVVEEAVVRDEAGRKMEDIDEINTKAVRAAKFVAKAYVREHGTEIGMVAAGKEAQIQARIMADNNDDLRLASQVRNPKVFRQVRLAWNSLNNKKQNVASQVEEAEAAMRGIEFKENSKSVAVETKRFYQLFRDNSSIKAVWEAGKRLISPSDRAKAVVDVSGKILKTPAVNFAREAIGILGKEGLSQGLMTVGKQLLEKRALGSISMKAAGVLGKTAGGKAVEKGLVMVAGKLLVKLGISSTGVGAVVMAAVTVVEKLWNSIKKIGKTLGTMTEKVLGKEGAKFVRDLLPTTGIKRWIDNNLPKWMSGLGNVMLDLATVPFILIAGLGFLTITPIITLVVVCVFVGMFFYQMVFVSNPVSSLVPPNIGGGCVRVESLEAAGPINCKTDLPTMTVEGTDRENIFRLADQWRTGENHVRQCLDDVICRSKNAGINPIFTIWVWLHESGASNYSIENVEDFGIHGQPTAPPKDFSAQLDYFLTLKMEAACPGLDPWLSLATNFLTGGCDPDFPHPETGQTGRGYLENIREQIGWVAPNLSLEEIPLRITPESCSGGSSTTRTYTDENGVEWICYDEIANLADSSGFVGSWDPNEDVPEGCPAGRPTTGRFTQGPFASGCSHYAMSVPAVDIGTAMMTPIRATHAGVVQTGYDGIYGYYIDLHGECEGKKFVSRYAHMPAGGYRVRNRERVEAGTIIGVVDNTGSSTGSHLHYDIRGLDRNKFGQYLNLSPETTQKLWGCCGWGSNTKICPP